MTEQQKEEKARQLFIEEVRKIEGRTHIHQLVEIIRKFNLNSRRDKALYDSDARLAREWIASAKGEDAERNIHNVRRKGADGKIVQEFVQERFFDKEDYRIKAKDETTALRLSYKKLTHFVERCFERYGVRLKVDLDFIKPISLKRRANRAERAATKSGSGSNNLFDEVEM